MRLLTQIKTNRKQLNIKNDVFAGIMVALVSIPISMGYAQIAGLPVVYGLYGSLLPILLFAFLTTSPQFVVGVDAMPAVMVGSLLAELNIMGETKEAMNLVPIVSLLVGLWFLMFYLFKAGRIVKYISTPVMGGFISGVGFTIILMQIPKLFGGNPGTGTFIPLIRHIASQISHFNLLAFLLGFGTVVIIQACKRIIPKIPMSVVMLIVGALLQVVFHLDGYGVKLLPEVSRGLPKIFLPDFNGMQEYISSDNLPIIILEAFSIALVVMAQTLLASGNYAMKYGDELDANAELLAYAGMNFISGAFGCAPINGSVSRSGIADSFSCRSQIMSIVASVTMLLVLLFGTPLLKYLPVPILTGIVMTALIGILEIKLSKRLWKTSKNEWIIFMLSFLGVLFFGTVNGVMVGCVLSFMEVAIRATNPPRSFIGRIPEHGNFYALERNSNARAIKGAVIYRFAGNLFFANIDRFEKDVKSAIKPDTKCIIIDARGIGSVDITAVDHLVALANYLSDRNIKFYITEHDGSLNDMLRTLGGEVLLKQGQVRRTITLALRDAGIVKPYELEGTTEDLEVLSYEEADERLAEMEWAFGEDAEKWIKKLANEAAVSLTLENGQAEDELHLKAEDMLDKHHNLRVHTTWGTLGRYDENTFWDHLEMRLEELHGEGRISDEALEKMEQRIETRRMESEDSLRQFNPHALDLLHEHQKKVRERFKQDNPVEYAHIEQLQKMLYDDLRKKNPELAERIKKLHDLRNE